MAARKKSNTTDETEVTVRATPETQVSIEATGTQPGAGQGQGGGLLHGAVQAVRDNPVPAGLVWAGLGWLALSAAGAKRPEAQGAQQAVAGAQQAVAGAQEAVAAAAGRTQEAVGEVVTGAQQRAGSLAAGAREGARSGTRRAREAIQSARFVAVAGARTAKARASSGAQRARTTAQSVVAERPEVVELAAAGAGLAVGLIVPATSQERKFVAPRREEIVQEADAVAVQVLEKIEQTLEPSDRLPSPMPA